MADRQRRSIPAREAILLNARALFREKGYASTTMRDIARACNFEPANIYNYFPSKERLLYELLLESHNLVLSSIKHLETDNVTSPVEQLRLLIKAHVNLVLPYRKSSRILGEVELRHLSPAHRGKIIELRDAYTRILCKVIRAGIVTGDFAVTDEKMACFAIVSMIVRTTIWFSPRGRLPSDEIGDFLFEFAFNALKGDRGGAN